MADQLLLIDSVQKRHEMLKCKFNTAVWNKLYRRDFLEKNEIVFPEHLAYEDIYFSALVRYTAERMVMMNDALYCYNRTGSGSTVSTKNESYHFDRLQVHLMRVNELCRRGFEKEFYQEIYGTFLRGYYLRSLELFFRFFDIVPYEVLNEMKRTVLALYPDYKNSDIYPKLNDLERGLLEPLEVEMTNERWDMLAHNYRFVMNSAKNPQ